MGALDWIADPVENAIGATKRLLGVGALSGALSEPEEEDTGPIEDWVRRLAEQGYDVWNMSPEELQRAAVDAGVFMAENLASLPGAGVAGLAAGADSWTSGGGFLDPAVSTINSAMQNSPLVQPVDENAQKILNAVGTLGEPFEYMADQAAAGTQAASGSPALATAASFVPEAIAGGLGGLGLGAVMRRGNMGSQDTPMPANQVGALGDFDPSMIVTPNNPGTQVSTRFPGLANSLENPLDELLLSDMAAITDNPNLGPKGTKSVNDMMAKNVDLLRDYPGMGRLSSKASPELVMGEFHGLVRDNLMEVFERMPDNMREQARQWYEGANKIRGGLAKEYGVAPEAVSGVMAALSPQKEWNTNLSVAERVIDTMSHQQNTITTPDMMQKGKEIMGAKPAGGKAKRIFSDDDLAEFKGQTLAGINDPKQKAKWIRLYDQTHNSPSYDLWAPDGTRQGKKLTSTGKESRVAWNSFSEIEKAVNIMMDPNNIDKISENLGVQHKVRNFYNNIENPYSDVDFYTSDTHNVAASLGIPASSKTPEVLQSFGGTGSSSSGIAGIKGTYPMYLQGGVSAAREKGIMPREMQSITWEGIRNMFDETWKKNPENKKKAMAVWKDYDKGHITRKEAWDRLEEMTGGIKPAGWLKP